MSDGAYPRRAMAQFPGGGGAHGATGAASQHHPAGHVAAAAGHAAAATATALAVHHPPAAVQQGLVGSPLKLELTPSVFAFFVGAPVGCLLLSGALFFGYIGTSRNPADVPLQLV
eukprot:TRINITY_DN55231_c0_g1_i1.p2 TRINITY_DN55231_c0_g1~~TRINITY_DN55231_c0_g1_i1.p2  ORF type:complete len:134 (+),score=37.76 TRINITY_DN55231_c0_g1_i1:60-404(+)